MTDSQGTKLATRVRAVWRREQMLRFVEGALVFVRWGLVLFLAGGFVDWMICRWLADVPTAGRFTILLVVLGVPLYKAWRAGWKSIRPFDATHTVLQIEDHYGGMESLLVSAMQFKDSARRHGTSDALCDLTCRKAEESAVGIRPKDAVRFQSLRRPAMIALIVVLFFGVLAATNGPLVMAGLGRISPSVAAMITVSPSPLSATASTNEERTGFLSPPRNPLTGPNR